MHQRLIQRPRASRRPDLPRGRQPELGRKSGRGRGCSEPCGQQLLLASTIKGVIYESGQFSPAGSGWLDSVIANGSIPSSCYDAADAALAGENPIGSAMYFNTGSGKGIKIGAHQFY
ncbi:MAG: cell wall hydrolase [Lachnospiraceae bacterium]